MLETDFCGDQQHLFGRLISGFPSEFHR